MTTVYNKLVRDRIPEIIEASGKTCTVETLSDDQYERMIDLKLDEELAEFHRDRNIEELADLMEVIRAAASILGYSPDELESVRNEKAAQRGGFEKRILLKNVIEEDKKKTITEADLEVLRKKQFASIERVVRRSERHFLGRDLYSGQIMDGDLIIVSDGYMLIAYHKLVDLKMNAGIPKGSKDRLFNLYKRALECERFHVDTPFDMTVYKYPKLWLRDNLRESISEQDNGGNTIVLSAGDDGNGGHMLSGLFLRRYIVDACEAVGRQAVGYLINLDGVVRLLVLPTINGEVSKDYMAGLVTSIRQR